MSREEHMAGRARRGAGSRSTSRPDAPARRSRTTGVDDGSRRGELVVYQADDFDTGTSRTTYALRDALGGEQPLLFDSDPKLQPGTPLKVWGNATTGDTLRVTSFRRMPPPDATLQSALIGATPFAARSFAFVIVDTGGGLTQVRWDGTMHDVTTDFLMGRLINDDDSLRNYYLGDSYQMQDITAKVIGPLPYTVSGCDTSAMATALRPMVDAQGGPFQHYLWYYGSKNAECSWSGLASVGTPQSPQQNTWYNQSVGCVVLIQEPGHNFGMQHSSSLDCGTRRADGRPQRLHDQRIRRSVRSHGRRLPAHERLAEVIPGLASGLQRRPRPVERHVHAGAVRAGVQRRPVPADQGAQAAAFMRPAAGGGEATDENLDYYYLEVRTPVDFDGTLGNSRALTPQVLVHMAADLRARTERGLHTFLLDMTPSTSSFSDAALPVGMPFTDPAGGLTITVNSVSNAGASITVEYAAGGGGRPDVYGRDGLRGAGAGHGVLLGDRRADGRRGRQRWAAGTGGRGGGGAAGIAGGPRRAGHDRASGASPLGTTGVGSAGDGPGQTSDDRGLTGGCACEVSGTPAGGGSLALLLGLVALVRRRSRRP